MTKFDQHAFDDAWNEEYAGGEQDATPRKRRFGLGRGARTRNVVAATAVAAIGITGVVDAATGGNLREGVRNGTTTQETQIISNINSSTGLTGGYSTRQSNLSSTGGGAVYGCRSTEGGSAASPPKNPCVRANNLSTGFAFEFNATNGTTVGTINAGSGGDTKKPFTTNATGVATGLNADRVDGANAADIVAASRAKAGLDADTVDGVDSAGLKTRWALINEQGEIESQSGGFSVVTAYPGGGNPAGNQNVYVNTGADARSRGLTGTIAIQNTNQGGVASNFGGELSIGACGLASINCAPDNTENNDTIVISPRNSDGTVTAAGARKRFYLQITE
ncbi:hypothetical protein GKE82_09785 [Conexibacter sp. W3-3-2]|uniref:Uncharacterized protein n=1 Tax=Paraconexibacter algicola TaxID=2133960 RepID=A0A2T4UGD1_9ACTN|nr:MULTISPECIES: hypothetical protein [Solirubrobacterales]MTD44572.1 hypothetical protein [Conexibacter sp. W3-3-2]PTL58314.1 hypothetical protein C7Y72_00940 [Paraconexibacter algicola]